jgi:hypothetical protein
MSIFRRKVIAGLLAGALAAAIGPLGLMRPGTADAASSSNGRQSTSTVTEVETRFFEGYGRGTYPPQAIQRAIEAAVRKATGVGFGNCELVESDMVSVDGVLEGWAKVSCTKLG